MLLIQKFLKMNIVESNKVQCPGAIEVHISTNIFAIKLRYM